jgi:phage-related holin
MRILCAHEVNIQTVTDRNLTQAYVTSKRLWIAYSKHEVLVFLLVILRHFIDILVRDFFVYVLTVYATG